VRFKLDENLPLEACRLLRQAGHDAVSVLEQQIGGCPDRELAAVCQAESRVLITLDTDFSNILVYPPADAPGRIVIRTDDQARPAVVRLMKRIATALQSENPRGRLWIVERDRIRIRG